MGRALLADEQRIALGEVARVLGLGRHAHQTAISVTAVAGGDALGNDRAAGVAPDMDHFGAGIGLLAVIADGHRVKLTGGVVAAQHHAGIFPGDGGTGFDLGPGNVGTSAAALTALGDEVVDAAHTVLVARVPVLHRGIFDLGVFERHDL